MFLLLGVALPLLVALGFPHPTSRLIVPESLMVAIAVVLTLIDGRTPGLIAAVLAPLFLWVFNVQPPFTLEFAHAADISAILATGVITSGLVLVSDVLTRRAHHATEQRARLGQQVDNQRMTITALQQALLPDESPLLPRVSIGWSYVPGGDRSTPIGGDWVALFPVGDRALGVAVGDVAGHGLPAVRAMAEYRFALKVLACRGAGPGDVLRELDAVATRLGSSLLSSCLYGILDVGAGTWTYSSAGHPPPLLRRHDRVETLVAPHGPPMGANLWAGRAAHDSIVRLECDDLIALYTDGLVERRNRPIDLGVVALADRIAGSAQGGDLSNECRLITRDLVGDAPDDDVAMVLIDYGSGPNTSSEVNRSTSEQACHTFTSLIYK